MKDDLKKATNNADKKAKKCVDDTLKRVNQKFSFP